MKNKFLILSILFCPVFCEAQTNTFPAGGSVGIGTLNPLTALDVRDGNILVKNLANETNESVVMIDHSLSFGPYKNFGTSLRTFTESAGSNIYALQLFTQNSYLTGQTEKVRISGNGNVGIGTTTPSEKLSVNGKIRAHEIKVEMNNWPDYVFGQDYKILGLKELDTYIKLHKHLPDMPSAKEVEANGLALGELVKLQQKKIEELTLHLIEKDKSLKTSEKKTKQLESNMTSVFRRLSVMEKKLEKQL